MKALAQRLSTWPKPRIATVSLGLVLAVGLLDYGTGLEVSVSLNSPYASKTLREVRGGSPANARR
jgi:hypothetical protein